MNWLNYNHLYYFWRIAREGSISKASAILQIGQPALSMQLRQLEDDLGHELFERKNRALHLTDTGRVVFKYAEDIFSSGHEMLEVLKNASLNTQKIQLNIGALDSVPKYIVADIVSKSFDFGSVSIRIIEGEAAELMARLSQHELDMVVANQSFSGEKGELASKLVKKIPVKIYGTERHQHLKSGFPNSLALQKWIVSTRPSQLREDLANYLSKNDLKVENIIEAQDTSLQKILGERGFGLVPLPAFTESVQSPSLIEIGTLDGVFESIYLISAERKITHPIVAELLKEL